MYRILIIAKESEKMMDLGATLSQEGFACLILEDVSKIFSSDTEKGIDLALIALDSSVDPTWAEANRKQLQEIKLNEKLPIIALISKDVVSTVVLAPDIDDFVVEPYDLTELVARVKRAINRRGTTGSDEIRCGGLLIDTVKYEVYLEGRLLSLAFKEYELLKFLAKNKGRAFSRDALLNEVWGYDYYGGDRTVDVHIRRLRSKIEDTGHVFIDTVRNIGYRFRERNYSPISEDSLISA